MGLKVSMRPSRSKAVWESLQRIGQFLLISMSLLLQRHTFIIHTIIEQKTYTFSSCFHPPTRLTQVLSQLPASYPDHIIMQNFVFISVMRTDFTNGIGLFNINNRATLPHLWDLTWRRGFPRGPWLLEAGTADSSWPLCWWCSSDLLDMESRGHLHKNNHGHSSTWLHIIQLFYNVISFISLSMWFSWSK